VAALRRNRDFVLLQAGQLLSSAGTEATTLAYPLVVLATSQSPAQAGLVSFARLAPYGILGLPAGVAADRWSRRRLMIAADAVRGCAVACLAVLFLLGDARLWPILAVAFVEGSGAVVFGAARAGALRGVVPAVELPAAVGAEEARQSVVRLGGPPVGGALFGVGHAVPFLADALSYVASSLSLLAMRTPFAQPRSRDPAPAPLRRQVAEGLRFLWTHPFLRTTALIYGVGNFLVSGMLLVIVVLARASGLSGGQTGALLAVVGAGTLAGALASPLFRRRLSVRAILLLELWTWLFGWLFVAWPSVFVLTAAMLPFAIAAPVTDSVVVGYRIALTPDRLLGRVESARSSISLLVTPLGPLAAGVLLSATSPRTTVAVLACGGLGLLACGMLSPSLRQTPSLHEPAAARPA